MAASQIQMQGYAFKLITKSSCREVAFRESEERKSGGLVDGTAAY
jgi:hypothetical protein